MRMFALATLVAAASFAMPAYADVNVGDAAPALDGVNFIMNAPEDFNGSNLVGQVTYVKLWGVN